MQTFRIKLTLLLFLFGFILISACGTTDTVTVVQDAPRTGEAERTVAEETDEFRQISLGMIDPITNLDPLFAENLSTKRIISLIYEGLFTLNSEGEPVPALADSVNISDNGLEYTIRLKEDIFFHDSRAFVAGVGRRLHASDVKWAFERTASNTVPKHASSLLMNVAGYNSYFTEQRNQFDVTRRVIDGVRGIEVVDARTLQIRLNEPDDQFLEKLASPYLSVYPREAVAGTGFNLRSNPVGTGMFRFRANDDGRIVLSKNDAERFQDIRINRIDVVTGVNESDLFQKFVRNEVDWIPETGPLISRQVLDDDGALRPSYRDEFAMIRNPGSRFTAVYLNQDASVQTAWLTDRLRNSYDVNFRLYGSADIRTEVLPDDEPGNPESEYFITFTENPTARILFSELNSALIQPESSLSYLDIHVVVPETALYSLSSDNIHSRYNDLSGYWLSFESPVVTLHSRQLSGIEPSVVPWLIQIRNLQVQNGDRQPS
jgi:ABC-type transport system substrate-binding protein